MGADLVTLFVGRVDVFVNDIKYTNNIKIPNNIINISLGPIIAPPESGVSMY